MDDIDLSGVGDAVASVMEENTQTTAAQIRNNFYNSATTSPDQTAEYHHLARFTGVPIDTVKNKPDLIKRQAAARAIDADEISRTSPATARFLTNPDQAAIAHDDVEGLTRLEKAIRLSEMDTSFGSAFMQGLAAPIQNIGQTLEVLGVEGAGAALQSVQSPKDYLSAGNAFTNPQEDDFSILGIAPQYAPRAIVEQVGQLLGSIGTRVVGAAAGASAGGAVGSAVPVLGTTAGAVAGGATGAFVGPFLFQAAQLVGPVAKERAQRSGYEKPTQEDLAYAWLTAAASGSLDAIGAKYLPGGEKATGAVVSRFAKSIFGEKVTETAQSLIEQSGASAGTKTGLDVNIKQAIGEGIIGGLTGGVATGVEVAAHTAMNRIATDRAKAERADAATQALQTLNDLAAASKVRARDAETFEAFVKSASENAPVSDVWIDAKTFAQTAGEKIAPLLEAMPEVREQIGSALATGGNLRIPVSDFAAKIAGTDIAPALIPHLKTEADGMSQTEAQEFMQTQGEKLKAEVEKVLSEKAVDDEFKASQQVVEKQILEQLNAAGRFTEDVNKPYATAVSSFYAVQAAKIGMTPEELAAEFPLQIRAGDVERIDTLEEQVAEAEAALPPAPQEGVFKDRAEDAPPVSTSEDLNLPIEDFGEKIEGARKDQWKDFQNTISTALPDDIGAMTLSEHFPEPNYENSIASGIDAKSLAIVKAARDLVPAKPKKGYRLARWAAQLKQSREIASSLINGELTAEQFLEALAKRDDFASRQLLDKLKLYTSLGYPAFRKAKGWQIYETTLISRETGEKKTQFRLVHNNKGFVSGPQYDNYESALGALREKLMAEPSGGERNVSLDIYRVTKTGEIIIGKKVASGKFVDLKGGFTNAKEARSYLQENEAALLNLLEKKKQTPSERRSTNDPRIGKDYREGQNVTPDKFAATFGFRGVQFGNYVEQSKRGSDLNNAYDALLDMADIIGVPSRALSLNGQLGLAFGARGKGGKNAPAAHYESKNAVINLTKVAGSGALGHEWWHALDNYFGSKRGEKGAFITNAPGSYSFTDAVRKEVAEAFAAVNKAIGKTGMKARSKELDKTRSKDYWSTPIEMTARAFEAYLIDKAKQNGFSNDYLANIVGEEAFKTIGEEGETNTYPYPTQEEMPVIREAFDNFFSTLQTRETPQGVELFQARTPDAALFARDLDSFLRGDHNNSRMLKLGRTPAVLQALGAKDLPLKISQKVLKKVLLDKHDVHPDTAANLPQLLADPVMVFDSATQTGDLVALIDATDTKGKPLTASIHLATGDVTINAVSSVYGRENRGWVSRQIEDGRLRYAHTEKSSAWFLARGLQLPKGKPFNLDHEGRNSSNRILTQADIVKKNAFFADKQGSFNPQNLTISLLKGADLSTFLHECGHFFLHVTADLAARPDAPAEIKQDMDTLLRWFGVEGDAPEARLGVWHGMPIEEQRGRHEQMARSFENYLFSGKAPSLELQPLFQRVRAWLLNVYRSLRDFIAMHPEGGKIDDEVRGVFDRMLATSEQIKNAEAARGMEPLFSSSEEAKMTPEEFETYKAASLQATQDAVQDLQTRSLRDMQWLSNAKSRELKRLQKEAADKRKAIFREVTDEVMAEPVNQAREFLRKGEIGGEAKEGPHRLDAAALREMYGDGPDALWRKLDNKYGKNGLVGNEGLHPDVAATMFGFSSGDELIRALTEAENAQDKIEGIVDQRMLERYGDLTDPDAMERAANEALHNDARLRFVATEMNALQKAAGQKKMYAAAAKQFAAQMIDRLRVRDIKPSQYQSAETRAARATEAALKKGDLLGAASEKRNQLIQGYAARAAYDAQESVKKWVDYLRKFESDGTRKNLSTDYLEQIDALLERFNLRERTLKAIDKSKSLAAWVDAQREIGLEPDIPEALLDEAKRKHFKDMTFKEMRGLVDTVRQIEHLGRLKNKLLTAKDKREFAEIVDGLVASIDEHAKGKTQDNRTRATEADRIARLFKGFLASHRKIASLARELDGFKDGGPMWETFIRTMNGAGDKEAVMREDATMRLAEIVKPILSGGKMGGKGVFFESIGKSLNREERLGIALNTGNAGNLQRLLDGEGWTVEQIKPILDSLTTEEADFVQSVWDFFETYRPEIGAKEKRVYGKEPDWVAPTPVEVGGKTLKGGYYPIKYDPRQSVAAERHADAEIARQQLKGAFTSSTTRRSFTKKRAEQVVGRPLLYSMDGLYSGVNEVIHDLAWHEWLIDANRLLRNRSLDEAVRSQYGAEVVRQFKTAVRDIAAGEIPTGEALDKVLGNLRSGATIAGLGFNLVNTVINVTGIVQSFVRIGPRWVAQGVAEWAKSPVGLLTQVYEKSDFMRLRAKTMQREINEIQSLVRGKSGVRAAMDRAMFWPLAMTQVAVDTPTWWGAYQKALAEGNEDVRAAALADQAVIDSQSSGMVKDLAAIQRGGPVQKLLTTFYGFFSTTYNLTAERVNATDFKDPMSVVRLGGDFLLLYSIPAALGTLIRSAIGGGDDPDELAKKLAGDQLSYLMGTMVGLRETASFAQKAFGVQQFNSAYGGPAGLRFFNALDQLGSQIGQGDADKALLKSVVNVGGIALRLPSTQINRTIDGIAALAEGKTHNSLAVVAGAPKK